MSDEKGVNFNVFIYVYRGFSRKKLRSILTVCGLTISLVFLILVLSMARGFLLKTSGQLVADPGGEDDFTPPDPGGETGEATELDRDAQRTIIIWLAVTSVFSVLAATAIISNTVYLSVIERRREIGILKAVGLTNGQVARVFVIETLWLSVLSWLIALFAGTMLASNVFNSLYEKGTSPLFFSPAKAMPEILLLAFLVTVLLSTVSSILPALKAARMEPVEAMNPENS